MDFRTMFKQATGNDPFPYQEHLATDLYFPSMLAVPTGMGKTAAAILGWLWRRKYASSATQQPIPRRLVYCLPMRVLVEQTRDCAVLWLHRLGLLAGKADFADTQNGLRVTAYDPWVGSDDPQKIRVHLLQGGDVDRDWDMYPERDAILIGTQDMLLSRALNRGYAMSRFRWPVAFGLLNNDCLWVMDEVQLMGNGLATTAQLQAFRRIFGTAIGVHSLWMSATIDQSWIQTVDVHLDIDAPHFKELLDQDRASDIFRKRYLAGKTLHQIFCSLSKDGKETAKLALDHHQPGTRTLVIVNTVKRAQAVYQAIAKRQSSQKGKTHLVLLHSRFRQPDRDRQLAALLAPPDEAGTIAVCTQVIEAGVDISAKTLLTELAPWSSLVQRFGRCNRYGELDEGNVFCLIPDNLQDGKKANPAPYELEALQLSAKRLAPLSDVGPSNLPPFSDPLDFTQVPRRKDILELFDTSPDLAGADIDVSRFIREATDHDVQVFWRDLPPEGPSPKEKGPSREELCAVPIDAHLTQKTLWRWDHLEKRWITARNVFPGLVLMITSKQGGYDPQLGWTGLTDITEPIGPVTAFQPEAVDDDPGACTRSWQTIAQHTDRVVAELNRLLDDISPFSDGLDTGALLEASRWHDAGKAHDVYRNAIPEDVPVQGVFWGKSALPMRRYERKGFRHELASALAILTNGGSDLAAYLAASHHGKVRMSIRSLPNETRPPILGRRFARGIWDGDVLPEVDICSGIRMPQTTLRLNCMELGDDPETGPSWAQRMIQLRNHWGPFRLAFLEALLRIADWRASADDTNPEQEKTA